LTDLTKHEKAFLDTLKIFEGLSTCHRHKIAALIFRGSDLLTVNYNGVRQGEEHCEDLMRSGRLSYAEHREWSKVNEVHAEINAIEKVKKLNVSLKGTSIMVSKTPCENCFREIVKNGISSIIAVGFWNNPDTVYEKSDGNTTADISEAALSFNINYKLLETDDAS